MPTILLVDDAQDIRLLVKAVLQRAGHEVSEADSGTAALAALTDPPPDAVILDIQMPGLDGWETLTRIRADDVSGDVPVLMCSVKASPEDNARAWELGCDGYLTKPFNITELVQQIEAVIARSPSERQAVRRIQLAAATRQLHATAG
jgi:DNA-binding response OmpR family regulator